MSTRGKQMFNTFKEASNIGPYDEYPMLPPGVDPQLHMSRNTEPQPFFLICEKDCVLILMSGKAKIHFASGPVRYHTTVAGDFVYVPAGMPHRIIPETECTQYRYKAEIAGLEGVAWYCEDCGNEVHREIWDTSEKAPQRGYIDACDAFNASEDLRSCQSCSAHQPQVDFDTTRWQEIASELKNGDA